MIRKLLATTALATMIAGSAIAQETTAPAPAPAAPAADPAAPAVETPVVRADGSLATNLIGETVYNGTADNAENIGSVNDLVIGANGMIEQVVVGVGGFLGLGEKNVALPYGEIDWAERDGDRWIVVSATKEQLQSQPDFDRRAYEPTPAATTAAAPAPATDTMAAAPADTAAPAPAAPADQTAQAPAATDPAATAPAATDTTQTAAIDRSTLKEMPSTELTAETLVGTTVYGADDANVGEIGDVALTTDGKVDAVILDVGGFLGMGEKQVAVGLDRLSFMTDGNGNNYLYTTFTKDQLDAAPAYDKSTWAEKRNDQIIMMQ